jgi:hypothetical protein
MSCLPKPSTRLNPQRQHQFARRATRCLHPWSIKQRPEAKVRETDVSRRNQILGVSANVPSRSKITTM